MFQLTNIPKFSTMIFFVMLTLSTGCASRQVAVPTKFSEQLGSLPQKSEEIVISKRKYSSALLQGQGLNEARLVEVFRREGNVVPQYRIFDVRKGSPYQLLGLEDGDVIMAADDRIIYDPTGFRTFVVSFLPTRSEATIALSRSGVTMLYKYKFVE